MIIQALKHFPYLHHLLTASSLVSSFFSTKFHTKQFPTYAHVYTVQYIFCAQVDWRRHLFILILAANFIISFSKF